MSARDIVEKISSLSDQEFALGEAAVRDRRDRDAVAGAETKLSPGRKLSHDEAMDYVFREFAPVLAKLAQ